MKTFREIKALISELRRGYEEVDCPLCDGVGHYWDSYFGQSYPCEQCGGSGKTFNLKD